MKESKVSMNIILVIVIFVSAVTFFITVKMTDVASTLWAVNSFNRIGESEYAVRYSNISPNGIYKGSENVNSLIAEGNFSYGDGVFVDNNMLYANEYTLTDLGLELCSVVKIDLETGEKTTLFNDAEFMGKCLSGELVIADGYASRLNKPKINSLCRLYALSGEIDFHKQARVLYFDAEKGKTVFTVESISANKKRFNSTFVDKTLQEVRG